MELFDLEIPIRSTGGAATQAEFQKLEQSAVGTATRSEAALGKLTVPTRQVGAAMRKMTADTMAASTGITALERASQAIVANLQGVQRGAMSVAEATVGLRQAMAGLSPAEVQEFGAGVARGLQEAGLGAAKATATMQQMGFSAADAASSLHFMGGTVATTAGAIEKTAPAAAKAVQGMGTLRSTASTLASQLLGVKTSVGQVSGVLGQMALGTGLTIGILAGITAIAAVYGKLTEATRKARQEQEKLNEQVRRTREEAERAADPTIALQEATKANLTAQLDLQDKIRLARIGTPVGQPGGEVRFVVDTDKVAELQKQLRALQRDAGQIAKDFTASVKDIQKGALDNLTALVAAGTATTNEEGVLRAELAKSKAALASMTEAQRATTEGRARAADLTARIANIEQAFTKATTEGTKAQKDAVSALRERVDLTLALGEQQGFTAARLDDLRDAVAALDRLQQQANLTDAQQLALLKARTAALAALTKAASAAVPNQRRIGLPPVPQLRAQDSGPAFPTSLLRPVQPQTFGGFGDQQGGGPGSAVKGFTDAIVEGLRAATASVTAAVDESIIGPIADKTQLLHGIGQQMGDALRAGLTATITTGVAALITGNGDVMLSALGGILSQMGEAMVSTGVAMIGLLPALSNPFTSGPALIAAGALIAGLGIALSSAATGSSSRGTGGRGAALAPINQTFTVQPATAPAQTGARTEPASVTAKPSNTFHFTLIGANDPTVQRGVMQIVKNATARGLA